MISLIYYISVYHSICLNYLILLNPFYLSLIFYNLQQNYQTLIVKYELILGNFVNFYKVLLVFHNYLSQYDIEFLTMVEYFISMLLQIILVYHIHLVYIETMLLH